LTKRIKKITNVDCDLLYDWVNDETVRSNSFNSQKISYNNHIRWFQQSLVSKDRYIYIFYEEDIPIGQIRLDIQGLEGIIDYSIDKKFRGKGYGTEMLRILEAKIKKSNLILKSLAGKVKYENYPSQKAFEKAGYNKVFKDNYIEYTLYL
jgi:RimJ/RimL family protein N-acetyltransferase